MLGKKIFEHLLLAELLIVGILHTGTASASNDCVGNPAATPENIANYPMINGEFAFPFTAGCDGCVSRFYTWFRYAPVDHPGYSAGNGGEYKVTVRRQYLNQPGKEVLDEVFFEPRIETKPKQIRFLDFVNQACFKNRQQGYVVMENLAHEKSANYISANGPYHRHGNNSSKKRPLYKDARPCDENYLLRSVDHGQSWVPVVEDGIPNFVYTPGYAVYLEGVNGESCRVGNPSFYGQYNTTVGNKPYRNVGGLNRVRQRLALPRAVVNPTLCFYASKLVDKGSDLLHLTVDQKTITSLSVPYNGAKSKTTGEYYGWKCAKLEGSFTAGIHYFGFYSLEGGEFRISSSLFGANATPEAWSGRAEYSNNGGRTWTGFSANGNDDVDFVQLNLYLKN